jgi:hypothetical protein
MNLEIIKVENGIRLVKLPNGSTVVDQSYGRLEEMIQFAEANGLEENLLNVLQNLCWNRPNEIVGFVYHDYAPLSLSFSRYGIDQDWPIYETNRIPSAYIGNGGIIFHGKHDGYGSGAAPTFSVCLTPTSGWIIHT